jgi:hypothetical protein
MRVLHLAAEIPVTPQHEIFDERGRFIARADLRIGGTRRIHEYDGAGHREADVHEVDLERDRALLAVAWLRGRACSTPRSLDGLAVPARTATGGEPLPKPVRCNKEKAAIWVVCDRLREDGSGALLAALTLGELLARHQRRQHRVPDDFGSDDHLCDVIATGNVVHDIEQDLFENCPQSASACAT